MFDDLPTLHARLQRLTVQAARLIRIHRFRVQGHIVLNLGDQAQRHHIPAVHLHPAGELLCSPKQLDPIARRALTGVPQGCRLTRLLTIRATIDV